VGGIFQGKKKKQRKRKAEKLGGSVQRGNVGYLELGNKVQRRKLPRRTGGQENQRRKELKIGERHRGAKSQKKKKQGGSEAFCGVKNKVQTIDRVRKHLKKKKKPLGWGVAIRGKGRGKF